MRTSWKSTGSQPESLSKVSMTSAMFMCGRAPFRGPWPDVPAKMRSSAWRQRTLRTFCPPSAQRTASGRLDLPEPLGPTTAVTPLSKSSTVRGAKVLKPCSSSRLKYMASLLENTTRAALAPVREHRRHKHRPLYHFRCRSMARYQPLRDSKTTCGVPRRIAPARYNGAHDRQWCGRTFECFPTAPGVDDAHTLWQHH